MGIRGGADVGVLEYGVFTLEWQDNGKGMISKAREGHHFSATDGDVNDGKSEDDDNVYGRGLYGVACHWGKKARGGDNDSSIKTARYESRKFMK